MLTVEGLQINVKCFSSKIVSFCCCFRVMLLVIAFVVVVLFLEIVRRSNAIYGVGENFGGTCRNIPRKKAILEFYDSFFGKCRVLFHGMKKC